VTAWEPSTGDSWGGRPIARRVADCAPRRRAVLTGTINATETSPWRGVPSLILQLDDASGSITVVFSGRRSVPGVLKGARCTVEATAMSNGGALVLWNPFYRFEPCECDAARERSRRPPPFPAQRRQPEE
jgi:hypothetical protein